jgi:sensor c-di-GMP phosphodiesterase-like protein
VQGYYFAKPMPAGEFARFIERTGGRLAVAPLTALASESK